MVKKKKKKEEEASFKQLISYYPIIQFLYCNYSSIFIVSDKIYYSSSLSDVTPR